MSDEQKQADKAVMARILGQDIDGGPAFDGACDRVVFSSDAEAFQKHPPSTVEFRSRGMSLRDYFAAKAMQAFVGAMSLNGETAKAMRETAEKHGQTSIQAAADSAYEIADAMLEARK